MTPEELQAIRERCKRRNDSFDARDEFARHARTDVPALLDEVERLKHARELTAWELRREIAKERDEARAEVERLRAERDSYARSYLILKGVHGALADGGCVVPPLDSFEVEETIRSVCNERDELLVRVANQDAELRATRKSYNGMRAELARLNDLYATQAKTIDALFAEAERLRAILGGGGFTYSEGETALRAQLASALRDAKRFADERDELRARLVVEQSK